MYSQEKVQQATDEIVFVLKKRQLAENSIKQYEGHYQDLNAYIKNEGLVDIDENRGFLGGGGDLTLTY